MYDILSEPNIQYKYIENKKSINSLIKAKNDCGEYYDDGSGSYKNLFFNFEIIYGDIKVNTNKEVLNNYNNIFNYKLDNFQDFIALNLTSNNDSLYNIKFYHLIEEENQKIYYIPIGGNFLLDLENNNNSAILFYIRYRDNNEKNYYIYFHPINCDIEINNNLEIYSINNYNFYQDLITFEGKLRYSYLSNIYKYDITNITNLNRTKSCMIQVSSYLLENGIILNDNISYIFVYNNKFNNLNFLYYFTNEKNDIFVNIDLLNKGKFIIELFIDKNKYDKEYNIESNEIIKLNQKELNQNCPKNSKICKLALNILNVHIFSNENIYIKILINSENYERNKNIISIKTKNKNYFKKNEIIFAVLVIFLILIIILISFFALRALRNKSSFKKIKKEIESQELEEIIKF